VQQRTRLVEGGRRDGRRVREREGGKACRGAIKCAERHANQQLTNGNK